MEDEQNIHIPLQRDNFLDYHCCGKINLLYGPGRKSYMVMTKSTFRKHGSKRPRGAVNPT